MDEAQIRVTLTAHLHRLHAADPATVIRQELGLCAGERRIDLAVINSELAGYEIKSDQDTLGRLQAQATVYGRVLDRITLVTTAKYVKPAVRMLPPWWGIIRADPAVNAVHGVDLILVRDAELNTGQDAFALAQLLWRDEAITVLRARGLHAGLSRKRRWIVWRHLADHLPLAELRPIVLDQLRARPAWPGGGPQVTGTPLDTTRDQPRTCTKQGVE